MPASDDVQEEAAILLVDDDPRNLIALEAVLADGRVALERATSGEECLRRLLHREFALVLLDVQMPGMNGVETAAVIRERPATRHIPIIFVTSHSHTDDVVRRAYQFGAVDFLFKPLNTDALRSKVAVFVELWRREKNVQAAERRAHERQLAECRANLRAQALKEQAQVLAEASAHKDRFLALLGHELRNPLASMRYGLALAAQSSPTDPLVLPMFERQLGHLEQLVDDLLDISRVSNGNVELRLEPTSIDEVVAGAVEQCRPVIARKGHALEVRNHVSGLCIVADGVRLTQILANLLSNAARYTDAPGRIELEIRRDREELAISVRDNGRGISAESHARIFAAFVQTDPDPSRPPEGLGLGLSLVRALVELHGGTVEVASEGRGRGSEFTVRIPIVEAEPDDVQSQCNHLASALDVLVIEDDDDARSLLEMFLRELGHRVRAASDGPSGFRALCDSPPDLALVDISLPGMDGLELAQKFRAAEPESATLLVSVSGYGQPRDRFAALDAGYDEYVMKPIAPAALHRLLDTVAARKTEP